MGADAGKNIKKKYSSIMFLLLIASITVTTTVHIFHVIISMSHRDNIAVTSGIQTYAVPSMLK